MSLSKKYALFRLRLVQWKYEVIGFGYIIQIIHILSVFYIRHRFKEYLNSRKGNIMVQGHLSNYEFK